MSDPNNKRHPESTFEAEYPYNQSTITRGGHEIHINDTPGKESLRIAHTKGSYVEIDRDGRTVLNSAGGGYYYFSNSFTTTVDGHHDVKVSGVQNVNVDGSVNEATAGNRYMNAGGDLVLGVGGTFVNEVVNDKYEDVGGSLTTAVAFSESKSVGFDSTQLVGGVKQDIVGGPWSVSAGGNIEIVAPTGDIRFVCKNFIVDAASITMTTLAGPVTITAAGVVFVNGVQIRLNDLV